MSLDVYLTSPLDDREVFTANITHNLGRMAAECGLYEPLWRPNEAGIETAAQLVQPLADGLALLTTGRELFEDFNPPNGWGDYYGFVNFVRDYLRACVRWPEATIEVSR